MNPYLQSSDVIDWQHPDVAALAHRLAAGNASPEAMAQRCFEWVRDSIRHSQDFGLNPVTCAASEVLAAGTGFCYAKSHLLVALLRANRVPAGLCYQRLSLDDAGSSFSLHGLCAVLLPDLGWYRVDPRGNKEGVDAQFTPPVERLAFPVRRPGEVELPKVLAEPLPVVVAALRSHDSHQALADDLPDVPVTMKTFKPAGVMDHLESAPTDSH